MAEVDNVPLGYVAEIRPSNVDKIIREGEVPIRLCNYSNVYYGNRITARETFMAGSATQSEIDRFTLRGGDVAITRDSESPDDIGVPAWVEEDLSGVVLGYHTSLIRPTATLDGRYLYWALQTAPIQDYFTQQARGITRFTLRRNDVTATSVPMWSLPKQKRIAHYLDGESSRIDRLVDRMQALKRLIWERFWSSVNSRLWCVDGTSLTLGAIVKSAVDGPFGSNLSSRHYVDSGPRVIRLGNVGHAEFIDEPVARINEDHYRRLRPHRVAPGDLIVAGLGDELSATPAGRACLVPGHAVPAIVKADCFRLRLNRHFDPEFVAWQLSSPRGLQICGAIARGSTRPRLNLSLLRQIQLNVPDYTLQRGIVNELNQERNQVRLFQSATDRQEQLLRERRQALITAAVMGDLDI